MESTKEFLNPNAMLTPGVAGAVTMMISNTFAAQFDLAAPWPAVVALAVSFSVGLLVIANATIPYWQRFFYYVLNSFIIFTVATGSNTLGRATDFASANHQQNSYIEQLIPLAAVSVPAAYAQPSSPNGWCCLNHRVNSSSQEECEKWGGQFSSAQEEAEQACKLAATDKQKGNKSFFRPWFQTR